MTLYLDENGNPFALVEEQFADGLTPAPTRPTLDHEWRDGSWVLPEPPTPTPAMVRAEGERRLLELGSGYTRAERETWPSQVDEAEAFMADNATPAPMLTALGAARGLTTAEMATRVLTLRDQFNAASAAILAAQETLLSADPIPTDYTDDAYWPDLTT